LRYSSNSSDKPLAGKRVVVTRAPEQASELTAQLECYGADVLALPTIAIAPPEDTEALDRAVAELDAFDWVIFTSRNAVKHLVDRFRPLGIRGDRASRLTASPRVAVIGSITSDEAKSVGFLIDREAQESLGDALAAELASEVRGKRVLLPRGDRAGPALPDLLRTAGADVVEVVAYRNVVPKSFDAKVVEAIREGKVDVITLFSPSAYENLANEIGLENLRRQSGKIALASIGPVTSRAVREDGLEVTIESPCASSGALCAVIAAYFRDRADKGTTAP